MKKLMLLALLALVAVPVALAAKPTTPGANGTGGKALVAKTLKVCWSFSNLKLTPLGAASATPTASHIHTGAGAILVPFGTSFARSGCSTTTKAIIDAILANPSGYYVNVHNAFNSGGHIRGEIQPM